MAYILFKFAAPKLWNNLPQEFWEGVSLEYFKRLIGKWEEDVCNFRRQHISFRLYDILGRSYMPLLFTCFILVCIKCFFLVCLYLHGMPYSLCLLYLRTSMCFICFKCNVDFKSSFGLVLFVLDLTVPTSLCTKQNIFQLLSEEL